MATKIQLPLIDNNHYKLTAAQAKDLAIDGVLPRHGYEKRANVPKLVEKYETGRSVAYPTAGDENKRRFVPSQVQPSNTTRAWILRTPLSFWGGADVKDGWVWALHLS